MTVMFFFFFSFLLALLFIRFGLFSPCTRGKKKLIFSRLLLLFVRLNYFFSLLCCGKRLPSVCEQLRPQFSSLSVYFFFCFSPHFIFLFCSLLLVIRCERRTHLPSETPTHCVTCSGQSFFNFSVHRFFIHKYI